MKSALIPALFITAVVIAGNVIYDRKNKSKIDIKRTAISAAVAFALTVLIGWAAE